MSDIITDALTPVNYGVYTNRQNFDDQVVTYDSFSGTDISAMIVMPGTDAPLTLGELQTISYSMHRENKPVRILGRVNPKGFVRGPRCLPASSKVFVKDRGYISIADVRKNDYVQSSGFTWNKVLGSFNQGMKMCMKLKLQHGYELTASTDHPIFTDRGWIKMEDLTTDDMVHAAGFAPSPEEEYDITDSLLKMIAYLIGDGSTHRYKKKTSESFEHRISLAIANHEMDTIGQDTQDILAQSNIPYRDTYTDGCTNRVISVCVAEKAKTDWRLREYNVLHDTLLAFGMYDKYSHNKFIPQQLIQGLNIRQVALFLRHLFATDGGYSIEASTNRVRVGYTSTSEELIDEVRLLLLKLGITSNKRMEHKKGKTGGRDNIISGHDAYRIDISDNLQVLRFINRIGIFGKDIKIESYIPHLISKIDSFLDLDVREFLTQAQAAIIRNGKKVFDFKKSYNIYNYNLPGICPKKALRLAEAIDDTEFTLLVQTLIKDLVEKDEDTIPTKVVFLSTVGDLQVYDLEVEDRHAFICDFVKVHNTIAGSMIFTVFNSYAFYRLAKFKSLVYGQYGQFGLATDPMFPLADMLPPFDIVLTFSNEYGKFARMKILGVTIVDEGGTMSVDDMISESTFTYMARGIQPLTAYYPSNLISTAAGILSTANNSITFGV